MQRTERPEGIDLPSPRLQKNQSSPNDRTPSISGSSIRSPPSVSPDPAYIAASAASQIVNSERAAQGHTPFESLNGKADSDTAMVSPKSLVLVNNFLDHLLFSFLASSRSTSIASLRPAILEVLKPRLGKEAVDGADEELQGYLAGGEAEELLAFHSGQDFKGEYNLNLVWRRTRLRCMVYTRLGDMEEEDEDMYLEQDQEEDAHDGQPRLTRDLGSVSPAAAIFLTSILEFIGEQALLIASEAAYNRIQIKEPSSQTLRAVVEEADVEKLAFNKALGRLWRSWKQRVRSSSLLSPRPGSRDLQRQRTNSSSGRISAIEEHSSSYFDAARKPPVTEGSLTNHDASAREKHEQASDLPEEPDFSDFTAGSSSPEERKTKRGRSHSLTDQNRHPGGSSARTPPKFLTTNAEDDERPAQRRQRSTSLPARQTPYVSPVDETFATPSEGPDPFVRESDRYDAEKIMPKLTDDSRTVHTDGNGDQAVSTMYDGAISQSNESFPETMAQRHNRGISTYTESSNYTDEYDHDLTPQALNLHKGTAASKTSSTSSHDAVAGSNRSMQDEGETRTPTKRISEIHPLERDPSSSPSRDIARDTSDEASPGAPGYDMSKPNRFNPKHRYQSSENGPIASSKLSQSQSPTGAGKAAGSRPQPPVINNGVGLEKAAVQRVSSSTSNSRAVTGRTSTSSNRDARPMTPGSTTSQMSTKIKGIIGRDSGDFARQSTPSQTSSEGKENLNRTPSIAQNFEDLMKSKETVKYTLTPQNMREMEVHLPNPTSKMIKSADNHQTPDSPRYKTTDRSGIGELIQDSDIPDEESKKHPTSRSATNPKGLNGLRSNPANSTSPTFPAQFQTSPEETVKSPSRLVPKSPGLRSPGAPIIDPSMKNEPVSKDFIDFVRSTQPPSVPPSLPDHIAPYPTKSSRPGSSSSTGAKASTKKITKQNMSVAPKQPEVQPPKRNVPKLQAREPTVVSNNETAALANFFREGPPAGRVDNAAPSQRSRTTIQPPVSPHSLTNGRIKEAVHSDNSVASTQDSFTPSKITQSSTNSRTGLLESSNRAAPHSAPSRNNNHSIARSDDPPGPTRQQRRPRDPYAIDSDSDNEDDSGAAPAQESLSDFLRDYQPGPEATVNRPPPVMNGPPKAATKQNSPTIRERLARNIAVVPDYRPLPPKNSGKKPSPSSRSPPDSKTNEYRRNARAMESARRQNSYEGYSPPNQNNVIRGSRSSGNTSSTNSTTTAAPPQLPPLNTRATSPHLVSQRPSQQTNRPARRWEARDEPGTITGQKKERESERKQRADMLAFFRETEPPLPAGPIEGGPPIEISPVQEKGKERSAFGKMFGRR
ncbi:hypothetical protein ACLMJK_000591 [Lecanora helva]